MPRINLSRFLVLFGLCCAAPAGVFAHETIDESFPAGTKPGTAIGAPAIGSHGLRERASKPTGFVGVEQSIGVDTGIPPSNLDGVDVSLMSHCSTWWLSGNHSWETTWYTKTIFKAQTNTYYGSATDPNSCGRPALVVDWIMLDGHLRHYLNLYDFLPMRAEATNTSAISKQDDSWTLACGGIVRHEARKSGITWGLTTKSGCLR